jgi:hypothetical protein
MRHAPLRTRRRRRAVAQQFVAEELGDVPRMRRVGETGLGRKRVTLQPFEEGLATARDDVGLGVVGMRVDESRQDQLAAVVGRGDIGREPGSEFDGGAAFSDEPVAGDRSPSSKYSKAPRSAGLSGKCRMAPRTAVIPVCAQHSSRSRASTVGVVSPPSARDPHHSLSRAGGAEAGKGSTSAVRGRRYGSRSGLHVDPRSSGAA